MVPSMGSDTVRSAISSRSVGTMKYTVKRGKNLRPLFAGDYRIRSIRQYRHDRLNAE